jgi:ATP-GRASP peptide maturase of grasp-with-spasm system
MNVLIFSELLDASTNDVINWLSAMNHNVFRINTEDVVDGVRMSFEGKTTIQIKVNGKKINLNEMDCTWYRRGHLTLNRRIYFPKKIEKEIHEAVSNHLIEDELMTIEEFIDSYLYGKPHLGNNIQRNSNKLIALEKARKVGLKTPNSEISSEKDELLNFFNKHDKDCISKGIQDILSFTVKNKGYNYATSKINEEDIREMNETFFPSLLQQNIPKKYELRIFYLRKEFYAMAIFSQNDAQTKVDFRNYNWEKPNRNVPYILPKEIERKLELFMQSMQLDCGSIDMIVTNKNEYVFLEVNPKGQYGMVSLPCNYHLDKMIVNELLNTNKKNNVQ